VEGSSSGLIEDSALKFLWRDWVEPWKTLVMIVDVTAEIWAGQLQIKPGALPFGIWLYCDYPPRWSLCPTSPLLTSNCLINLHATFHALWHWKLFHVYMIFKWQCGCRAIFWSWSDTIICGCRSVTLCVVIDF